MTGAWSTLWIAELIWSTFPSWGETSICDMICSAKALCEQKMESHVVAAPLVVPE